MFSSGILGMSLWLHVNTSLLNFINTIKAPRIYFLFFLPIFTSWEELSSSKTTFSTICSDSVANFFFPETFLSRHMARFFSFLDKVSEYPSLRDVNPTMKI